MVEMRNLVEKFGEFMYHPGLDFGTPEDTQNMMRDIVGAGYVISSALNLATHLNGGTEEALYGSLALLSFNLMQYSMGEVLRRANSEEGKKELSKMFEDFF